MTDAPFFDEDSRVLTPEAFDYVLNNELKRAVRSQNYLTLVVLEARRAPGDRPDDGVVQDIARLVSREVRETDLLARTGRSRLSIVLLDADMENSTRVVDRVASRLSHYEFPAPVAIAVSAASCPTHAVDAESLKREAERRRVAHVPAERERFNG